MISNIDYIREHKFSWIVPYANIDNSSRFSYIIKAIKDKSNKKYGIIICSA